MNKKVMWFDESNKGATYRLWYDGPGWYYITECASLNGPFEIREDAEEALRYYTKWLNQ